MGPPRYGVNPQAKSLGVRRNGGGIWTRDLRVMSDEPPVRTVEIPSIVIDSAATSRDSCQQLIRSIGMRWAVCHQFVIRQPR